MTDLGCDKFPTDEDLPKYWPENKAALLNYMNHVSLIIRHICTLRNTFNRVLIFRFIVAFMVLSRTNLVDQSKVRLF